MFNHNNNMYDWPPNPFINNIVIDGSKEKIKVAFMSVFVAPFRLMLMSVCVGMAYVAAIATLLEMDVVQKPLKGLRRKGKDLVATFVVWAHVVGGFEVTIKGKKASPWEAPILVMAPHSSFFDALPYCLIGAPSVVGKKSLFNAPILGKLLKVTFPIMVDRDSKDSRKTTIEKIKERAARLLAARGTSEENDWSQIAMFPEGTCTNRTQLITFKPGAFYPQLPVQPVCLRWTTSNAPLDNVSWAWEGAGVLQIIWLTVCKVRSKLEIEYLPVHIPDEAERNDATLFARNVRKEMAKCLGVPTSEYSLEDAVYLTESHSPLLEQISSFFASLNGENKFESIKDAWEFLRKSEYKAHSFLVNFDEFLRFLRVDYSGSVQRLFNAFDWECTGKIDLREFIIARHATKCSIDYFRTVYQIFAGSRKCVDERDFIKMCRFPLGFSLKKCRQIYASTKEITGDTNCISFESIVEAIRLNGGEIVVSVEHDLCEDVDHGLSNEVKNELFKKSLTNGHVHRNGYVKVKAG